MFHFYLRVNFFSFFTAFFTWFYYALLLLLLRVFLMLLFQHCFVVGFLFFKNRVFNTNIITLLHRFFFLFRDLQKWRTLCFCFKSFHLKIHHRSCSIFFFDLLLGICQPNNNKNNNKLARGYFVLQLHTLHTHTKREYRPSSIEVLTVCRWMRLKNFND